jgi:hypothetical protein
MNYKAYLHITGTLLVAMFASPQVHADEIYTETYTGTPNYNFNEFKFNVDDTTSFIVDHSDNNPTLTDFDKNNFGIPVNVPLDHFILLDDKTGAFVAVPGKDPNSENRYDPYQIPSNKTLGTFRLSGEFAAGRFIAIDQNYGGASFFVVPSSTTSIHPLFDIRGFKLENKDYAASAGIGMRFVDKPIKKVYGINAYYDYLYLRSKSFHQWGVGFELLSGCWEFHVNGYLPVSHKHYLTSERTQEFPGGFVTTFRQNEFALKGVEFTAGGRWNFNEDLYLYIAPGFYFYNNRDIGNFQGFQCTAEINWNDWISFKLNSSYDSKFKGRFQGVLSLNLPFDIGNSLCECTCRTPESRMVGLPVRRNDLIFIKKCCSSESNFDECGLLAQ